MSRMALLLRLGGALTVLCSLTAIASAQWVWRDPNGRPVYSDQPPPATVRASDILQQPTAPPSPPSDAARSAGEPGSNPAPAPSAPSPAAAAPHVPTTAEREQEFRKRQKERAEVEKKQADEQVAANQKAENCDRARGYMKSLQDNIRLVRTHADGSQELLDSDQRESEMQRTRDLIDSSCN